MLLSFEPLSQALSHHHRVPPRLPSVPRSSFSPSPVSPDASAARSLRGRRWCVSRRRGEESRSPPWCQRSVRVGRGRDRTARAAAVTPRQCHTKHRRVQRRGTTDGHSSGHGFLRTRSGNGSRDAWFCGSESCWL